MSIMTEDDDMSICNYCNEGFYHFHYFRSEDDLLCYYCIDIIDTNSKINGHLFIFNIVEL